MIHTNELSYPSTWHVLRMFTTCNVCVFLPAFKIKSAFVRVRGQDVDFWTPAFFQHQLWKIKWRCMLKCNERPSRTFPAGCRALTVSGSAFTRLYLPCLLFLGEENCRKSPFSFHSFLKSICLSLITPCYWILTTGKTRDLQTSKRRALRGLPLLWNWMYIRSSKHLLCRLHSNSGKRRKRKAFCYCPLVPNKQMQINGTYFQCPVNHSLSPLLHHLVTESSL